MINQFKLKATIKYPTSVIVNGLSNLGIEIADSLLAQGGYVILVDAYNQENLLKLNDKFGSSNLVSFVDYSAIPHLQEDIRRLDYVFYLSHVANLDLNAEISTQSFLKYSNYLDTMLDLAVKFEAKLLLTTSIRAHQMMMSRMDIDMNFGTNVQSKHTVYTEMEVQRYAESLCLEYATKKDLNVRIVRVGEIIGEGMDFSANTAFTKMVLQAVAGQDLVLQGDGLDTDWFVHLLDAAYGVIKAQFSKDTESEVFSLAYENNVTQLSMAYKIQELEANAKEIVFKDEGNGLPPIRLHKPAPNLAKIGWKPRIDFEKAIAESLSAAKLHLLKSEADHPEGDLPGSKLVGKLRSFFSVADATPTPAEIEMLNSGPVSRLIAERKRQEQMRGESMDKADQIIRGRWRDRQRTPMQKLSAWIWRNFLDVRTNFGFLRQMTPAQFFGYLVIGVVFVAVYFAIVSPLIVFVRNVVVVATAITTLQAGLESSNYQQVYASSTQLTNALKENVTLASRFQGGASILGADKFLSSAVATMQSLGKVAEGVQNISYAAQPLDEYLTTYKDNTRFRLNNETYLSVTEAGTDYSPILGELTARSAFVDVGATKIAQGIEELKVQDYGLWPQFVSEQLEGLVDKFDSFQQISGIKDLVLYGPDLFGVNAPRSYLVVLIDNSRPMPVGGELSAYMMLTLQNGAIADLRLQSIDTFSPDLTKLSDSVLKEINLNSFQAKNKNNVTVRDLAFISNYELFGDTVAQLWEESLSRTVDGVVVVNYNFLSQLLNIKGNVTVDGQVFTQETFLTALASLQTSTPTNQRRNDIVSQVWAGLWERIFDEYKVTLPKLLTEAAAAARRKDLVVAQLSVAYSRAAAEYGLLDNDLTDVDVPLTTSFVTDAKQISPSRYPAVNQAIKYTINPDLSATVIQTVKFPAVPGVDFVVFCTNLASKDLKIEGIDSTKVRNTKSSSRNCMSVDVISETELTFSFTTLPIESLQNREYNLEFGVSKNSGSEVISDFEVTINPALSLVKSLPQVPSIDNKIAFTQTLVSDQRITLTLK